MERVRSRYRNSHNGIERFPPPRRRRWGLPWLVCAVCARARSSRQRAANATTALIEIDFQHWIIALAHDREVVGRAALARMQFRTEGALVVCTRHVSTAPTDPMRSDLAGHGASFIRCWRRTRGDLVLTKYERDVFTNPDLRLRGITASPPLGRVIPWWR